MILAGLVVRRSPLVSVSVPVNNCFDFLYMLFLNCSTSVHFQIVDCWVGNNWILYENDKVLFSYFKKSTPPPHVFVPGHLGFSRHFFKGQTKGVKVLLYMQTMFCVYNLLFIKKRTMIWPNKVKVVNRLRDEVASWLVKSLNDISEDCKWWQRRCAACAFCL